MSQQRRFRRTGVRRIGMAAVVMSAGTFALVSMAAPAGAAAKPCPQPTDPDSTFKYWQCQWKNFQDSVTPPKPKPQPKPKPKPDKPKPAKPKTDKPRPDNRDESAPRRNQPRRAPSGGGSQDGAPAAYAQPGSPAKYSPATTPELPGMLPAPQVAPGTRPPAGTTIGGTRLIRPVAAYEQQQDEQHMLWVAIAAGAAGAVGAMNISVLTRRVRRVR